MSLPSAANYLIYGSGIFERRDHTLLNAHDLSRLPVNHTLDLSRTDVVGLWDGWIQWFASLLIAHFPIILSSCRLHTHFLSNIYFLRSMFSLNYWLFSQLATRPLKPDFFPAKPLQDVPLQEKTAPRNPFIGKALIFVCIFQPHLFT